MSRQGGGLPAFFLVMVVIGGFGAALWINSRPAPALQVVIPTEVVPTDDANAWQGILRQGFGSNSTPLPTVPIPTAQFVPPTLAISVQNVSGGPIAPTEIVSSELQSTPLSIVVTPTRPVASPTALSTIVPVTAQAVTRSPAEWNPPPLEPPISRDPYGRDHYWFRRPIDSDGANYGLSYYPYGSDGSDENPYRVHHGIDMSNPVGEVVRAAGSGWVTWAADGLRTEGAIFENSPSYGNVVQIEHDFSYRGQKLWTIYAHLSAILVTPDQYVNAGDVIGLVGNTGRVTGPHVHFEVRWRETKYANTLNPLLWMVPYVGHGVIAGRVTDTAGNLVDDADITVRNRSNGLVIDSTTTYVYQQTGYDVNGDPLWQENFAVGDIPVGRYEVIATFDGNRISRVVDVLEGTTSFVDLSLASPPASGS